MFFRLVFMALPCAIWLAMWPLFAKRVAKSPKARLCVWFALGCCYGKFVGYRIFGGSTFLPVLPKAVIWIWSLAYSFAMLLGAAMLLLGALGGILRLLRVRSRENRILPTAAAVGALAVAAYGIEEGWRVPRVKERTVVLDDLPPEFDGYRIVQLSDLHISPAARKARTEAIVQSVNALAPDLVCITGDLVDGLVEERREDARPLADLKAKDGVLACCGNHEFYSDYDAWRPVFLGFGIDMLDNAHRTISRNGATLAVGGVIDPHGFASRRTDPPDARLAFASCPPNAFRILLAHRPTLLEEHAAAGVKLQLSGHTHGGAIRGMDILVAAANEGHVRGFYRESGVTLFVNPGTGQWGGFPMRLGVPSEITCLTLRKQGEAASRRLTEGDPSNG